MIFFKREGAVLIIIVVHKVVWSLLWQLINSIWKYSVDSCFEHHPVIAYVERIDFHLHFKKKESKDGWVGFPKLAVNGDGANIL